MNNFINSLEFMSKLGASAGALYGGIMGPYGHNTVYRGTSVLGTVALVPWCAGMGAMVGAGIGITYPISFPIAIARYLQINKEKI